MTAKKSEQVSEDSAKETAESTSTSAQKQDWMEVLAQEEFWTESSLPDQDDPDEEDIEIGVNRPVFERDRLSAEERDKKIAEEQAAREAARKEQEEKLAAEQKEKVESESTSESEDEDSSEEVEDVTAPKVLPDIAPPGGIGKDTPSWVASFQGGMGKALLFLMAFSIFSIFAGKRFLQQSNNPHYVMLADAFLNGRLHLKGTPRHPVTGRRMLNDWAYITELRLRSINGKRLKGMKVVRGRFYRPYYKKKVRIKGVTLTRRDRVFITTRKQILRISSRDIIRRHRTYYVSFPPLPALAMMVPMWMFKKVGLPYLRYKDTVFTLFFAALAVVLMFWLLQKMSFRGYSERTMYENLLLTLLFGFGTVFFFVSVQGTVWFTALVMGTVCLIPAVGWILDERHPFFSGALIGLAFLARPLLILTALLFFYINTRDEEGNFASPFEGARLDRMIKFCVPLTGIVLAMMTVNYMRFQSPFEFGHLYLPAVYHKAMEVGLFHPAWFYRNFMSHFFMPPYLSCKAPYVKITTHGLSMFLVTPVFLFLFFSYKRNKRFVGVLGMMLVILLPTLFYQNTGWETFGNRFSVDYSVFLILLLAMGRVKFGVLFKVLLLVSIAVNAFGAATFNRYYQYYLRGYGSIDWIYKPGLWFSKLWALLKCVF